MFADSIGHARHVVVAANGDVYITLEGTQPSPEKKIEGQTKTPRQILDLDIASAFTRLGLEQHISMNRRNGFYSMVERIKKMAAAEAA